MSQDDGLIDVYIPILSGRRASRVMLPGDCTLANVEYGGLAREPRTARGRDGYTHRKIKATARRPHIKLSFRLVERYDQPVERLFRIVRVEERAEMAFARELGTIAVVDDTWEIVEMEPYARGTRVSDIRKYVIARGLNRIVLPGQEVVRVNGIARAESQLYLSNDGLYYDKIKTDLRGRMIGGQRRHKNHGQQTLQWELRYQTRRNRRAQVSWAFIGTSADYHGKRVPQGLIEDDGSEYGAWRELQPDLYVWLSAELRRVANA